MVQLTVCSCHVTYAFQSESTLKICWNVSHLNLRFRPASSKEFLDIQATIVWINSETHTRHDKNIEPIAPYR